MASAGHRNGTEPRAIKRGGWLSDFAFSGGMLRVRKTGATAPLDAVMLGEVAIWLVFYVVLRLICAVRTAWRGRGPSIGFVPDVPRPWYLVRSAALWAGMPLATNPAGADVLCFFEDATVSQPLVAPAGVASLNFGCSDISKSHVARVFEAAFGYPLAIDPRTFEGIVVEKSEINSLHDGRLVHCPREPVAGKTYQRFIDTSDGGEVHDLRTPCIAGQPVLVWEKSRPATAPFSVHNKRVRRRLPAAVYSQDEVVAITRFCTAMGLDWGGLDILRCQTDGRIYVVDVNKTDVGPIIALSLPEKLRSVAMLAAALRGLILARTEAAGLPAIAPTGV